MVYKGQILISSKGMYALSNTEFKYYWNSSTNISKQKLLLNTTEITKRFETLE